MNKEITDEIAIATLTELIADRENKKNSLSLFMTDEIENLQKEINSYRRQLQQIEKGVSQ